MDPANRLASRLLLDILIGIAVLALAGGVAYLTRITAGVGFIAAGCGLGILARIHQAGRQHRELKRNLARLGEG